MLRSRGNRGQRPSGESTDESNSPYYGGYPSYNDRYSSPMSGIDSGAASDNYGKQNRSFSGSGTGGLNQSSINSGQYGSYNGNIPGGFQKQPSFQGSSHQYSKLDKKMKAGSSTSTGGALISFALIVFLCLSGSTFHYKRAYDRLQLELKAAKKSQKKWFKGHWGGEKNRDLEADEDGNDDEAKYWDDDDKKEEGSGEVEEEESAEDDSQQEKMTEGHDENQNDQNQLQLQNKQLSQQISRFKTRNKSLQNSVTGIQKQISHLDQENKSSQAELEKLTREMNINKEKANGYKQQFENSMKDGKKKISGIVLGGPGGRVAGGDEEPETLEELEEWVQKREDNLWEKIDLLVERIEKESRREALERFGPGPHKIEMEIEYPKYAPETDPSQWPLVRGVLVIEMAPLDLMPHAVNLFLQQVHHKLWNGCAFVINAMHILQAGPHQFVEKGQFHANLAELLDKFTSSKLDKVSFQEYSEDYPHSKFTVGFAGRPGGPDFYINKIDNSVNHGPGGQNHHDLHEEADPCFGRLISGTQLLDDINQLTVDYDKGGMLLHPVVIVDARVMTYRDTSTGDDRDAANGSEKRNQNSNNVEASSS